jgi:hypothetical protein
MRPKTLAEVTELTLGGSSFDLSLKNFLDGFYAAPTQAALDLEPRRMREALPEHGHIQDAYIAAVAEALAQHSKLAPPSWAFTDDRKLRRPWFALDFASLRAVLLRESPAPFRSRNLFVSENALSRV